MKSLEDFKANKAAIQAEVLQACQENRGQCQDCRFDGKCQQELYFWDEKIQAYYCQKSAYCLECDYLTNCKNPEATMARYKKALLDKAWYCIDRHDCAQCKYWAVCSKQAALAERTSLLAEAFHHNDD